MVKKKTTKKKHITKQLPKEWRNTISTFLGKYSRKFMVKYREHRE